MRPKKQQQFDHLKILCYDQLVTAERRSACFNNLKNS